MPSQSYYEKPLKGRRVLRYRKCKFSLSFLALICCFGAVSCLSNNAGSVATVPVISLSATSINFGSYAVGSKGGPKTLQVTNTSGATVSISAITITGADAGDFSQTNNCKGSLVAGANCSIQVTFKPSAPGTRTTTLDITDDPMDSPQAVTLSGTAMAKGPTVTLSPTGLTFASQTVDTTSAARTIMLTNTGTAALSVTKVVLSGGDAGDFSLASNCGSSVAAGANCTISITFKPTATGTRTSAVTITDNATGSHQSATLSGTGTAAATTATATLSPTSLTYASQSVGTTSAAKTITLTNSGTAAMTITSIGVSGGNAGDFAQVNNCGSSVAAGASCTISITFKPTATGTRTSAVTITDNATGSHQSATLSGTAASAAAAATATAILSSTSLAFTSKALGSASASQGVTLTNSGKTALSISSITVTGTNSNDFTQTNNCGSSVATGVSCTITVTFDPSASGNRAASLTVTDNASGSPQSVALSGTTGGSNTTVTLSPASLVFSLQPISLSSLAQTVTLTNTATTTLSIANFAVTGVNSTDFIQNNNCGNSVASGVHCAIVVVFIPSGAGTRTAALSVSDNAAGSPQTVSMSGGGSHDVALSWLASPTADVTGYNIYRGTAPGGESTTPLNSTPVTGTTYTDENVAAGTTYYYAITSVTSDGGAQSSASPETSATIP